MTDQPTDQEGYCEVLPPTPASALRKGQILTPEKLDLLKTLYCAGEKGAILSTRFGVKLSTIRSYAKKGRWPTPRRVKRLIGDPTLGIIETDDPARALAQLWASRKDQSREDLYHGAYKALQRFFALQPVPQSFTEAKIAKELLDSAISDGKSPKDQGNSQSINLALITNLHQPTKFED